MRRAQDIYSIKLGALKMKGRSWALTLAAGMTAISGLGTPGPAAAWGVQSDRQQAADAQVEKIGDPVRYLQQIHEKVEEAKASKNRRLTFSEVRRLDVAERKIHSLVSGRTALTDLNSAERADVFSAQETIDEFASNDGGDRLICKSIHVSGTRLKTTQCKTKAESDAITQASQESLKNQQRGQPYTEVGN